MMALIITGGECSVNITVPRYDICIAADCGYLLAQRLGVFPNYIVGDFDSLNGNMTERFNHAKADGRCEIVRHSPHKNETDTMLAVSYAEKLGASDIYILGGLGGRADHSLSNIFLLERLAADGIPAILTDGNSEISVVSEGETTVVPFGEYRYFSTLALDRAVISITGCAYPLDHSILMRREAYAVSNEPLPEGAKIVCHEGRIIFVRSEKL